MLEIILAVALFMIFGAVLLRSMVGVPFDFNNASDRMKAQYLLQEGQEAIVAIRNYSWDELTVGGPYGLENTSGYWELSGTSDTVDGFTRTITIFEETPTKYDVDIDVSWTTDEGISQTVTSFFLVTHWEQTSFSLDTYEDFVAGYFNGVLALLSDQLQLSEVGALSSSTTFISENYGGTGDPTEFHLDKNNLYISFTATNPGGEFALYDVKDVSRGNLVEIDSVEFGVNVNDFVVDGNYAYLATDSDNEVQVVRLSDMSIVETLNLPETHDANGIDINGTQLVVTRDSTIDPVTAGEIYNLNASNPESLSVTNYATLEYDFFDVKTYGGYAFVVGANGVSELEVYQLSDMSQVNLYNFSDSTYFNTIEISSDGSKAYLGRAVTAGEPEFVVFDISQPTVAFGASDVLGSTEINDSVNNIDISNGTAFLALASGSGEIASIDLSTYSLSYTLNVNQASAGNAVAYYGAHIYVGVSHDTETIQVLETTAGGWSHPTLFDSYDLDGNLNMTDIVIDGSYAYLGRESGGTCVPATGAGCEFVIFDISSPASIAYLGGVEIGADVNDLYVSGNYAYLANDGVELQVVDITTKTAPSIVGSYDSDGVLNGESVWGSGNYVYLGTAKNNGTCQLATGKNCELYIIDVTTPSSPVHVSGVEINFEVTDIQFNNPFIYLATPDNSGEIKSIDLSNPASPGLVVSYDNPGRGDATGMSFDTSTSALHITFTRNRTDYDYLILEYLSGGSLPSGAYGLSHDQTHQMVVPNGSHAYMAGETTNSEIEILDISDIHNPFEVGVLSLGGDANGVATDGTYAFIAGENNTQEVQVVGASPASFGTNTAGMFVSQAFDAVVTTPTWGDLFWSYSGLGTLQLQIRTASTEAGLAYATWVGPGGDPNAFFTTSETLITPYSGASGRQFIQVAAYFEGDGAETPMIENITIYYTP